ncbi:tetratricopeptide repeat-containing sensor histidine kinase [Aestuariivivens marinum]|uniref:tetratricopeptide repeat-containing sensor histidine kinase n=1 Tax=Aestuariivivens marinum TaxID=2913555 RepID=UPI001F57994C|nr:sensor histidine kinase [Aestuariivivens marinum]
MLRLIVFKCLIIFSILHLSAQDKSKELDSLNRQYQSESNKVVKCNLLYDIGAAYLTVNIDSSVSAFTKLKVCAEFLKNDTLKIKGLLGMGKAFTDKSKLDSAQYYFNEAEKLIPSINNKEFKKSLYINRGILFFYKSNYNGASVEFKKALTISIEDKDVDTQSRCYNNIAICKAYLGDFEGALQMHIESAKIAQATSDELSLAKSYNNIGLVYIDLKDYKKAEGYFLKSLEIKKRIGNIVDIVGAYLNLGVSQRNLGVENKDSFKLKEAKHYFENALSLSEKGGYINGRNNAYINLALVENSLRNYGKAIEFGKRALQASIKSHDTNKEMTARINLGDSYRYNKQFDLAEQHLLKGYEMAKNSENSYVQKETLLILSLLHSEQNNFKKALEYHKQYYALTDSISSSDVKNKVNELETQYQTEKKEKEILEQRAILAEKELNLNKKNTQLTGLILLALLITVLGFLLYKQQKLKNQQLVKESELKEALIKIETQNKLQEQRLRISRDLHDNIGAQLTFIISSIENLQYGFKITNEKLTNKLENISGFTKETIYELRDTIWAMNKSEITLEDLQIRISNFVEKASASSSVHFEFNIDDNLLNDIQFISVKGMNIYRIIQEAVNNAIKHAKAKTVLVSIGKEGSRLRIEILDDGKGFDLSEVKQGNGLNNMKKRANEINSKLIVSSELGKGTSILFTV